MYIGSKVSDDFFFRKLAFRSVAAASALAALAAKWSKHDAQSVSLSLFRSEAQRRRELHDHNTVLGAGPRVVKCCFDATRFAHAQAAARRIHAERVPWHFGAEKLLPWRGYDVDDAALLEQDDNFTDARLARAAQKNGVAYVHEPESCLVCLAGFGASGPELVQSSPRVPRRLARVGEAVMAPIHFKVLELLHNDFLHDAELVKTLCFYAPLCTW